MIARRSLFRTLSLGVAATLVVACGGAGPTQVGPSPAAQTITVTVQPAQATVAAGASFTFTAVVAGTSDGSVTWSVAEASGGAVDARGAYTAPQVAGTFHVVAASVADAGAPAVATVTVTAPPDVTGTGSGGGTGTPTGTPTGTDAPPPPPPVAVTAIRLASNIAAVAGGPAVSIPLSSITPSNAARTDLAWFVTSPDRTSVPSASDDASTWGAIDASGTYTPPAASGNCSSATTAACPLVWAVSKASPTVYDASWIILAPAATSGGGTGSTGGGGSALSAPGQPTYADITSSEVTVSWTAVPGAAGYKLERSPDVPGTDHYVEVTAGPGLSFTDTGLAAGTRYWYRVRATDGGRDGPYSAESYVSTSGVGGGGTGGGGTGGGAGAPNWPAIAGKAVFFMHASVGQYLMDGVESIVPSGNAPAIAGHTYSGCDPSATGLSGADIAVGTWTHLYASGAGSGCPNGQAHTKLHFFDQVLRANGNALANKLNAVHGIAFFKFCYVDIPINDDPGGDRTNIAGLRDDYVATLSRLQADFPNITFVHATQPIVSASSSWVNYNPTRNEFDDLLRAQYGASGKLWDLAAAESVDGTYTYAGYPALDPAFTADGSHPDSSLGETTIATSLAEFLGRVAAGAP